MNGSQGAMTLSQYAAAVGQAVRMSPVLHGAWVVAELSDVRVNGGHCYMELIEKSVTGQTMAKMRATIWASTFQVLRRKFFAATGRDIATGMKVMLNGSANHHILYGLSFTVNDIDPSYTLGDMERLRREILMKLQGEGVLNNNKALQMPGAPQKIAVISAEGAAGYGDFINHLEGNAGGFVFYPFLFPAIMQGDRTAESVIAALEMVEQTRGIASWDCVVIIRGGGATTDLNGFDDYNLARAVATFPLPVVVGIGHERDRTVLDEIAHTRCKTPTAVASFLEDTLRATYERTAGLADWVARYSSDRIQGESRRLANCESLVPMLANARISGAKALLDREMARIPVLVGSRLSAASGRLENYGRLLGSLSDGIVRNAFRILDVYADRIKGTSENAVSISKAKLDALEGLVGALSPVNTLKRGYSVTRVNGKAVRSASGIPAGTLVETELAEGILKSKTI